MSEVGVGTTFRIFFPAVAARSEVVEEKRDETLAVGGSETILVVEDEALLRELVQCILERHGYNVLQAPNGVAALEVWRRHRSEIDLLLTDMVMPEGMTGRDLAERLLAEEPALKVIFTSGYSAEILAANVSLQEGVNFLFKPFLPEKLTRTIGQCLARP
jgi:two-component system, cell cycle sensor histidine kinase and response regulator CckA